MVCEPYGHCGNYTPLPSKCESYRYYINEHDSVLVPTKGGRVLGWASGLRCVVTCPVGSCNYCSFQHPQSHSTPSCHCLCSHQDSRPTVSSTRHHPISRPHCFFSQSLHLFSWLIIFYYLDPCLVTPLSPKTP